MSTGREREGCVRTGLSSARRVQSLSASLFSAVPLTDSPHRGFCVVRGKPFEHSLPFSSRSGAVVGHGEWLSLRDLIRQRPKFVEKSGRPSWSALVLRCLVGRGKLALTNEMADAEERH